MLLLIVRHLERHEEANNLERVVSPVHVVSHKEVVGGWAIASDAEELAACNDQNEGCSKS